MPLVCIDATRLSNWNNFHQVFAAEFGFPNYYGCNMNAWIDCMTNLDEDCGMTKVIGSKTDPIVLQLDQVEKMPRDLYDALVESAAFVNYRRIEQGEPAILILAFHRSSI